MTCAAELELVPFVGYVARGTCGESCSFTVSEIVGPRHFDGPVCEEFRKLVMGAFGPGGPRTLVPRGTEAFLPHTMGSREEPFRP